MSTLRSLYLVSDAGEKRKGQTSLCCSLSFFSSSCLFSRGRCACLALPRYFDLISFFTSVLASVLASVFASVLASVLASILASVLASVLASLSVSVCLCVCPSLSVSVSASVSVSVAVSLSLSLSLSLCLSIAVSVSVSSFPRPSSFPALFAPLAWFAPLAPFPPHPPPLAPAPDPRHSVVDTLRRNRLRNVFSMGQIPRGAWLNHGGAAPHLSRPGLCAPPPSLLTQRPP